MQIVVVQETDWLRRGPHQQHHLFERLSLRGHHVTVLDYPILRPHWPREALFAPTRTTDNAARVYSGARIELLTPGTLSVAPLARPSSVWSHYRQLARLINSVRPDVIVSYALSTGLPALSLARQHRIPFVFHVIDALHAIVADKVLQPIAQFVERRLFQAADEVILINEHLRDYAVNMGALAERTCVVRTGVDLDRFTPSLDGAQMRSEWGIKPDDVVLFFMGWIYSFSGVREVAASLSNMPSNIRLLIVGDGDDYAALCEMQATSLGNRVILTGRVPYEQVSNLLAAADVCLLPFHIVPATEHIVPIKLYEYMAAGKPVISAPLPGVYRDVGKENGVVYAPAPEQVNKALEIHSQAVLLGSAARRFVETYCDWNAITDDFEAILCQHAEAQR